MIDPDRIPRVVMAGDHETGADPFSGHCRVLRSHGEAIANWQNRDVGAVQSLNELHVAEECGIPGKVRSVPSHGDDRTQRISHVASLEG